MIRIATVFLALAAAQANDKVECGLDGFQAANDMLDAAVFIWAAVKRCDKAQPVTEQDPIRCSLNIAAAIESVNGMFNVVLKAAERCGALGGEETDCGLAVSSLTKSFAGLAAGTSGVLAKCPNSLNGGVPKTTIAGTSGALSNPGLSPFQPGGLAQAAGPLGFSYCLIDMKDSVKSIFKGMRNIMDIRPDCKLGEQEKCATRGIKVVSSIASIGEFIAGSLGRCSRDPALRANGQCIEEYESLARYALNVASAGTAIHRHCTAHAERLYADHVKIQEPWRTGDHVTAILATFLPMTAVLGFALGRRAARRQVPYSSMNREMMHNYEDAESADI